mmetsp:Transcript_12577/g.23587  ORF Transcript_12577/g.23587 Transcript_12577/m.23587 type:complete len:82 (+) Transcript_12577:467-712(+)
MAWANVNKKLKMNADCRPHCIKSQNHPESSEHRQSSQQSEESKMRHQSSVSKTMLFDFQKTSLRSLPPLIIHELRNYFKPK